MARIDWILDENGEGQMGDRISHLSGVRRAVLGVARDRAAVARGHLLAHRAEGHAHITVTRGDVDAFVNLVDRPSESNDYAPAAAAIEFGNKYGGGGIDVLGRAFGLTDRVGRI